MGDGYLSDQDIFADEDSQPAFCHNSPKTPPTKGDTAEVSRLRGMMGGIPPPPDKTNPQINITQMLEAWKSNVQFHWTGPPKTENGISPKKRKEFKKKKIELITNRDLKSKNDEMENSTAPTDEESENDHNGFDVYLNLDTEEEEMLRLKVAERLVSSETSSSFMQHVILTNSAKKRQRRNGWAKSPGSRLSYLAKRRTTFSHRPGLGNSRTISILKDDKSKPRERKSVPLKRALFQSPDKMDFSTPDCSRIKRLKLEIPSPRGVTPPRSQPLLAKQKPSVSRNLETTFNKFVPQGKPDVLSSRQIDGLHRR